ncbi:MAG: YdcH family protein [Rhodomicrobium sp.]
MSLFAHIEELSEKHQAIHRQIEAEMNRPLVDSLKVSELKRRKLRLKEKIEKLKSERNVA